ncbi:ribonucleoside triphosphate reductase [Anopheles sinensis]|uniref:Ribonucleoside triphosphate reductase n=1 Tax=Anopheles sinensis TaxID=74873 RepID=A0A084VFW3_ANOSI|nr:ribonucleoside triphosphate reductase [Anopheles sinensis]
MRCAMREESLRLEDVLVRCYFASRLLGLHTAKIDVTQKLNAIIVQLQENALWLLLRNVPKRNPKHATTNVANGSERPPMGNIGTSRTQTNRLMVMMAYAIGVDG